MSAEWRKAVKVVYLAGIPLSAYTFARINRKEWKDNTWYAPPLAYTFEAMLPAVIWPATVPALLGKWQGDRELAAGSSGEEQK